MDCQQRLAEFFVFAVVNQQSAKCIDTELLRPACRSKEDLTQRASMNVWAINKDIPLKLLLLELVHRYGENTLALNTKAPTTSSVPARSASCDRLPGSEFAPEDKALDPRPVLILHDRA